MVERLRAAATVKLDENGSLMLTDANFTFRSGRLFDPRGNAVRLPPVSKRN